MRRHIPYEIEINVYMTLGRRNILKGIALSIVIGLSGCLSRLLGYDVMMNNPTDSAVTGSVKITDRQSGSVVLDKKFELGANGETKYNRIGNHQHVHEVEVETEAGLSNDDLWNPGEGGALHLTIRIEDDEVQISRIVN